METKWSLDDLYTSFDSQEYQQDFNDLKQEIERMNRWADENFTSQEDEVRKLEEYVNMQNDFVRFMKLSAYAGLTLSVDTMNSQAAKALDVLGDLFTGLAKPSVMFESFLEKIENLDEKIDSSELLKAHQFVLKEMQQKSRYRLSEAEEIMLAKLQMSGSNLWSKMREQLTSTLSVDITINGENKQEPLSVVRNYAYDKDPELRKNAYEAELKSYEKIDKAVSFALNGVKGEALTISKMRRYESPLDMALFSSRMNHNILNALLEGIEEYLPVFQKYLRKKGEYLNHQNGLPFYDLFAPVGEVHKQFSYDEAAGFVIEHFTKFSKKLGDFAIHALQNKWVDALPAHGKQGGAFCSNLHAIKQSRILLNFTGPFSDVTTLAHELGHAYHGDCLKDEYYNNSHYPMPIAETASIFCETIVCNAAIEVASPQEAAAISESSIADMTQVIVDIYSRFLFEDEVFKRRDSGSLQVGELKEIMLNAQKKCYGDGLNHDILHPYMWLCKPHYYYASENYYNFPYAYGLLFAKGCYARYLNDKNAFVEKYDEMLSLTGKLSLKELGDFMGMDVESKGFWRESLQAIANEVETLCETLQK